MIARLRGILLEKHTPDILLECGGVGYEVCVPLSTFYELPEVGTEAVLLVQHIVREDAERLFGFQSAQERSLFRALVKVNGIGPKLALAILSGMSVAEFAALVHNGETSALVKLPGVGRKTAERLVVEMQDNIKTLGLAVTEAGATAAAPADKPNRELADAESALIALGYKPAEASRAIAAVSDTTTSVEALIKAALQVLTQ